MGPQVSCGQHDLHPPLERAGKGRGIWGRGWLLGRVEAGWQEELIQLGYLRVGADEFDLDRGQTAITETEGVGGSPRKVDHTALGDRSAVIDGDDDRFIVAEIGDPEDRTERQSAMRAGELILIEGLAAGGRAAVARAAPRRL